MATISEIAPDVFSICTYIEQIDLQFRQFLIRAEQPLLYHTGTRRMFEGVRDAVGAVMDPSSLRWIAFRHFEVGAHRLRFLATPHLPHGWDAGHLYDETAGVLFCSDLLHHLGDVAATTTESRVAAMRAMLKSSRGTPMDWYIPWTPQARARLERLAALQPRVCATMHGSAYIGDGAVELRALSDMLEEVNVAAAPGR